MIGNKPSMTLLLALALASTRAWADCAPPSWLKAVEVKRGTGDVVGVGKGPNAAVARREARRSIALKIAKAHSGELFGLPSLKGTVNTKVYAKDELVKGLGLALALDVKDPKRLQSAVVCGTAYIGLLAKEKVVLDEAARDASLADEVNAAMTGGIDKIEAQRAADEDEATSKELSGPEATAQRLKKLADGMDDGDFLQAQLQYSLRKKADSLLAQAQSAKAVPWPDQRAKAIKAVDEVAVGHEKFAAAAREIRKRDYTAAIEMFNAMASAGDENAQFVVGYMHAQALGAKRDYGEALTWFKRAAAKGHGPAKAMVGILVFSGRGAKADATEAFKWIDSAYSDGWTCAAEIVECRKH